MRIVFVALVLAASIKPGSASAQPTLLAIEDGEFSFFEPIMNESGEAFAILGFSLVHQDGSLTAPNPILDPDGPIGGDTLKLIHTDSMGPRPLAPVFGSDAVLLNARIERPDTTQVNSLIVVSPSGQVVDQIDGDNLALFGQGVTPTDLEFGMQSARSYLGDAIPNNQIETVIGFATALIDQTNGPTTSYLAAYGSGGMKVLFSDLGFRPTLTETHGGMKDTISISDVRGPIGAPIPSSAPAFRYGYSNVNGPGSFVIPPVGSDDNTLTYESSLFLVAGGSGAATRLDSLAIVEALTNGKATGFDSAAFETFFTKNTKTDEVERLVNKVLEAKEFHAGGEGSTFVADLPMGDPPSTTRVAGRKSGPISTEPEGAPEGCDCDATVDPGNPASPKLVDLDENGVVDIEDDLVAIACVIDDPAPGNCRDVNGDGNIDLLDFDCVAYCSTLAGLGGESGPVRGLDPTLVNPRVAVILLREGFPIPDRPDRALDMFGLVRSHPNGFGLFGVRATRIDDQFDRRNLLIAQALNGPPKTVFEEGVDYGDGVVASIPGNGVSNINRAGQFAVVAILENGETAIYRVQIQGGFPPPPNKVRRDWKFYI